MFTYICCGPVLFYEIRWILIQSYLYYSSTSTHRNQAFWPSQPISKTQHEIRKPSQPISKTQREIGAPGTVVLLEDLHDSVAVTARLQTLVSLAQRVVDQLLHCRHAAAAPGDFSAVRVRVRCFSSPPALALD